MLLEHSFHSAGDYFRIYCILIISSLVLAQPSPCPLQFVCVLLLRELAVTVSFSQSCLPEEVTGYQLLQSFLIIVWNHFFLIRQVINYRALFISVKPARGALAFNYNLSRFSLVESSIFRETTPQLSSLFSVQAIIISPIIVLFIYK